MSQLQKITDEQMDAVGVVSAPDVLTGTPSENKNVFDKMVRQLIAPAYNRAVDAIDAINQTESGIQAAEAVRVAAENGRVQAESSRAAAETQRSQAEQARMERESDREAAEQLRSTQETARVQAESSRISAEQERNSAESARASAEAARISAEQGRLSQEELRRQAEQERGSKEEARNAAESARASAESGRGEAERERVSAETARTLAEQERVQAENRREDQETGYIAQAKDGALSAKSWAVGGTGTRAGEDTNNAQFWAQQAAGAAGGGVSSFNGRAGVVLPQSDDYTAEMVGADAAGSAEAVQQALASQIAALTAQQVGADPAGSAAAVQKNLNAHTGNKNNPHAVTAAQVGAAIELSEGSGITTLDELLAKRPSGFYGVSPPSTGFPRSDYWNVIVWADKRVPSGGNYTRAIYASPVNSNELWKLQITNGGNKGWVRLVTESDLASKSSVQTGSYAGTGSSTLDLDLPIEPKALILAGSYQAPLVITGVGDYYCIYDNVSGKSVDVTEFGKHVSLEGENTYSAYNESGSTYFWTALY